MCLLLTYDVQWCNFILKEYKHYDKVTYFANVSMNDIVFDKETFKLMWRRGLPFLDEWRSFRLGMTWCARNWHHSFRWHHWPSGPTQNLSILRHFKVKLCISLTPFYSLIFLLQNTKETVCLHQKLFFNLNSFMYDTTWYMCDAIYNTWSTPFIVMHICGDSLDYWNMANVCLRMHLVLEFDERTSMVQNQSYFLIGSYWL